MAINIVITSENMVIFLEIHCYVLQQYQCMNNWKKQKLVFHHRQFGKNDWLEDGVLRYKDESWTCCHPRTEEAEAGGSQVCDPVRQ